MLFYGFDFQFSIFIWRKVINTAETENVTQKLNTEAQIYEIYLFYTQKANM